VRSERRAAWEKAELEKLRAKGKEPKDETWKAAYIEPEPVAAGVAIDAPQEWGLVTAATIVQPNAEIVYGIVQPGEKLAEGVPYVRGMDIEEGEIKSGQLLKTSIKIAEKYDRSSLKGGDVLLGIIRATKVAIVPEILAGANITQGTARLRPSSNIFSRFLAIVLKSPAIQDWLHAHYRGIDMPGLNLADVRLTPVPLPSLPEQSEIVRRVDELFAYADALEKRVADARVLADRLEPSILAKAFRGKLSEQIPKEALEWERKMSELEAEVTAAPGGSKKQGKKGAQNDRVHLDSKP
jgi:type I restriction enzyme S subunit